VMSLSQLKAENDAAVEKARIARQTEIDAAVEATRERMRAGRPTNSPLTVREHEVAKRLVAGESCREIAHALGLSIKTVDTHRCNALRRLQCANAVHLVHYFIRKGWLVVEVDPS
jgi:DNA-binding NarL/FixJ family response regulator